MRIAFDATPAAIQRGGVGRYARELLRGLLRETLDHRFTLSIAASGDEAEQLSRDLPPGAWREVRRLPARERVMTALWQRARLPVKIERWIGSHDVYHGTDFVLPPTSAATVVTVHDLSFLLYPELSHPQLAAYLQRAVPRAVARADVVITVSASVSAELATAFPNTRRKIIAIPNGVSLPPAARPENRACGPPTVLMVGTIEPRKNHRTIVSGFPAVREAAPDARLVIVGRRGWLYDDIEREIERGRAAGWLDWIDDAGDDQLEDAYRRATVFVAASRYEGFGLTVLEAMARGAPCVVSDIAAHREVSADAAVFVDPDDQEGFVDAISELLNDDSTRERLSAAGRARACTFDWRETARRTLRAYERAAIEGRS